MNLFAHKQNKTMNLLICFLKDLLNSQVACICNNVVCDMYSPNQGRCPRIFRKMLIYQ